MTTKLNLRLAVVGLLIAILVGTTAVMLPRPSLAAGDNSERGSLHVSGRAAVSGSPDIAYVQLGVETRNESAQTAAAENAALITSVMDALKKMGFTEADLSTRGYNVYSYQQTNRSDASAPPITIYVVQNNLEITVRDLDMVGEVIDAAIAAGANQVQSVRFDIENKQDMQVQALENAIKQARMKAEAMARASGVVLGGIRVITEQSTSYVPYTDTAVLRSFAAAEAKTQITPGDVEVSADVNIEFWF